MMRAAQKRGHQVFVSEQEELFFLKSSVAARAEGKGVTGAGVVVSEWGSA